MPSPGAAPAPLDLDAGGLSLPWSLVSQTDTIHLPTSGPRGLLSLLPHPDLAFAEGFTHTPKCPGRCHSGRRWPGPLRAWQVASVSRRPPLDHLTRPNPSFPWCLWGSCVWDLPGALAIIPPPVLFPLGQCPGARPLGSPRSIPKGSFPGPWCLGSQDLAAMETSEGRGHRLSPYLSFSPSAHLVWSLLVVFESPAVSGKALPLPRALPSPLGCP